MKDYINQVLGNSLRCILPSFWWKRLLGMLSDKVDSAQSAADNAQRLVALVASEFGNKQDKLVSGSNIKTINGTSLLGSGNISIATWELNKYDSEEDLANNGSDVGGEIATVVDKKYIDKSFSECYKPQSSESGSYNAKFTRVSGITLKSTFGFSSIPSNYNWFRLKLISDGKSKGYHKEYPYDIEIEWGYWYSDRIMCWEHDASGSGTGHTIFTSSGRDENSIALVNKILENGDFRFLCLQVKTTNGTFSSLDNNLPDDAYAMIDRVVNMRYAETINADVYVRSAEWVKLLKEGDVTGGGADITIDSELSETSENPVQNKVITDELYSFAEIVETALNDKANASDVDTIATTLTETLPTFATKTYVDNAIANEFNALKQEILDNEEVVATALNNLNERVSQPKHIVFNLGAEQSVNKEAYDAFFSADGFPSVSVIAGDKASFEMYPVYGVSGSDGEPLSLSVLSVNDGTVSMTRYIVSSNGSILIGQ